MFHKIDQNRDGKLSLEEAQAFFTKFSKVSANAMFNEVRAPFASIDI
jgi:hypothetical protein